MDLGVVDPGFSGPLGFTIINFGSSDFEISKGLPIATLVLIRTDGNINVPYQAKKGPKPYDGRFAAVASLSRDFLNIVSRAKSAAAGETKTAIKDLEGRYVRNIILPAAATATLTFLVAFLTAYSTLQTKAYDLINDVNKLERRLEKAENKLNVVAPKLVNQTVREDSNEKLLSVTPGRIGGPRPKPVATGSPGHGGQ